MADSSAQIHSFANHKDGKSESDFMKILWWILIPFMPYIIVMLYVSLFLYYMSMHVFFLLFFPI